MKFKNTSLFLLITFILIYKGTVCAYELNRTEKTNKLIRWGGQLSITLILDKSVITHFMDNYNYDFVKLTEKAFDIWTDQAQLPLSILVKEGNCKEAKDDEICIRTAKKQERNPNYATAYVTYAGSVGEIFRVDIKFYEESLYDSEFLLLSNITHELGHAWGLGDSDVKGSLMFPTISINYDEPVFLHNDDIKAIKKLYGFTPSHLTEDVSCSMSPKVFKQTSRFDLISSLIFPSLIADKNKGKAKATVYNDRIKSIRYYNDHVLIEIDE